MRTILVAAFLVQTQDTWDTIFANMGSRRPPSRHPTAPRSIPRENSKARSNATGMTHVKSGQGPQPEVVLEVASAVVLVDKAVGGLLWLTKSLAEECPLNKQGLAQ